MSLKPANLVAMRMFFGLRVARSFSGRRAHKGRVGYALKGTTYSTYVLLRVAKLFASVKYAIIVDRLLCVCISKYSIDGK